MSKKAFAFLMCVFLTFGLVADTRAQTENEKPLTLTFKELIANKEKYNGKFVTVRGRMFFGFEANVFYARDDDRLAGKVEQALWIDVPDNWNPDRLARYNGGYGKITGRFLNKKCNGHLCLFGGEIIVDKWEQLGLQN